MTLLAVRLIDLAIFGSLGGLWIGGAIFIVVLYRWILRFEAEARPAEHDAPPTTAPQRRSAPALVREPGVVLPPAAASHGALPSHP